jgi:CheY-like chemotaxis protein
VLGLWGAPWLLRGYGYFARSMLAPAGTTELALRVRHLSETRTEALDTGAAEIRRIERNLHDGAQARLVAMPHRGNHGDPVRVVIAEDLFLLRDGLTRMLQARGLQVAAAVDNGADLLAAVTSDQPDVAIVDVRLPPSFTDEGIRAALAARRAVPGLPVLVLSQYVEQLYARELLASGAGGIGYLLKDRVSTAPSSSTPSAGSPRAAPRWTRR